MENSNTYESNFVKLAKFKEIVINHLQGRDAKSFSDEWEYDKMTIRLVYYHEDAGRISLTIAEPPKTGKKKNFKNLSTNRHFYVLKKIMNHIVETLNNPVL